MPFFIYFSFPPPLPCLFVSLQCWYYRRQSTINALDSQKTFNKKKFPAIKYENIGSRKNSVIDERDIWTDTHIRSHAQRTSMDFCIYAKMDWRMCFKKEGRLQCASVRNEPPSTCIFFPFGSHRWKKGEEVLRTWEESERENIIRIDEQQPFGNRNSMSFHVEEIVQKDGVMVVAPSSPTMNLPLRLHSLIDQHVLVVGHGFPLPNQIYTDTCRGRLASIQVFCFWWIFIDFGPSPKPKIKRTRWPFHGLATMAL